MDRNEELEQWALALESEQYQQGRGSLFRDDEYCCLGVKAELDGVLFQDNGLGYVKDVSGLISSSKYQPLCITEDEMYSLMRMNDRRYSFKEIANALRSIKN